MRIEVIGLDPGTYSSHALHHPERAWNETNCTADLWVELLQALGHDPVAGLGFTLSSEFYGAQWRMATFPPDVLYDIYGIGVDELYVWRPLRQHLVEELALGHLVSFDADAWWLPDTAGLTYRSGHHKTTVCAQMIDLGARRLGYFHNAGYYELEGDDLDGLLPACPDPAMLAPLARQIRPGGAVPPPSLPALRARAAAQLRRLAPGNPLVRLAKRVECDLEALRQAGMEQFHRWAFGTLRQCGAGASLAAAHLRRLEPGPSGLAAVTRYEDVADTVKSAQLLLARAAHGRAIGLDSAFGPAIRAWDDAVTLAAEELGVDLGGQAPALAGALAQ